MYTLAADFGTSSVKAAVIDGSKKMIKTAKRAYQYEILDGERVELSMTAVEEAFKNALSELKEYLPLVDMVGFDTFAPSLVLMDEEGRAIHPIVTHLDRRSRSYTKKIIRQFGKDRYRDITGTLPHSGGVTLTTLLWFKENRPELYGNVCKIGHLNTYFYRKLTGKWAMDQVNASITGMYKTIAGSGWSEEICRTFGIEKDLLPPVEQADGACTPILGSMAVRIGVRPQTLVSLGTQDVASAMVGAGMKRSGQILCISGSSEMIAILTDRPVTSDKYYLRASGLDGLWQVFSITTGGFALEWIWREFYKEMDYQVFFHEYLPELLEKRFDTNGVTFLPYVTGDRQSLRKKKGSFNGLTLDTERDHLLCAVVEGIQMQSKKTLDFCRELIPIDDRIKVTGNLAENEAYLKIKRRVFGGMPMEAIENCPLIGSARRGEERKEETV